MILKVRQRDFKKVRLSPISSVWEKQGAGQQHSRKTYFHIFTNWPGKEVEKHQKKFFLKEAVFFSILSLIIFRVKNYMEVVLS